MESLNKNYYYDLDLQTLQNNDLAESLGLGQNYTKKNPQFYPLYSHNFDDDLITVYKEPFAKLVLAYKEVKFYIKNFLDRHPKNNVIFLTINPSREFIYMTHNSRLLTPIEQLSYCLKCLKICELNWLSVSFEQGTQSQSKYTMYHFHIIILAAYKNNFKHKQDIKKLRDYFTVNHKTSLDHFQSAVKQSPTDYSRLDSGILYFMGFVSPELRKSDHLFTIKSI